MKQMTEKNFLFFVKIKSFVFKKTNIKNQNSKWKGNIFENEKFREKTIIQIQK